METVKIQVVFEETVLGQTYRDAIYYSNMDEFNSKTLDGSHSVEKTVRMSRYEDAVNNPSIAIPLTKAQLLTQKEALQDQINVLNIQISEKI